MKFFEGTVVSLTSFLLGVLAAYAHVFLTSSVLFFLTVVPYSASTIVPSWRAATVDPDSVMRA